MTEAKRLIEAIKTESIFTSLSESFLVIERFAEYAELLANALSTLFFAGQRIGAQPLDD